MKICRDCKHFQAVTALRAGAGWCSGGREPDPVWGGAKLERAEEMRRFGGPCGPEAKLFVQAPDPDQPVDIRWHKPGDGFMK